MRGVLFIVPKDQPCVRKGLERPAETTRPLDDICARAVVLYASSIALATALVCFVRDSSRPGIVVCLHSDPSGVLEDDMLHLLGDRHCRRATHTHWYAKLFMAVDVSATSHRFVYRLFGFVSRWPGRRKASLFFQLGFSRECGTCEHGSCLFFLTCAAPTVVDACEYWFAIRAGVGGACLPYLKGASRPSAAL